MEITNFKTIPAIRPRKVPHPACAQPMVCGFSGEINLRNQGEEIALISNCTLDDC
jgi:hypothetical protein